MAKSSFHFGVAIIGAGPAGSVAAIILARAGHRVALIEQHRFPREKVCGECLSALGIAVLTRIGLTPFVQKLQPVALKRSLIHSPDGESFATDLPQAMWGLSRRALDDCLLHAARDAGAILFQPARCENLMPLQIRNLADNSHNTLTARFTLLADGKGALLPSRPPATSDFGIKCHFKNVSAPANTIELFGVDGHYGGLAPIEGNRWNAAFSVPASVLSQHRGDLNAVLQDMLAASPPLRNRLAGASRCSPWITSPLPRFPVQSRWPENIIPLGNAAAALEPVGGEGMGLAMRSAELAAAAVSAALAGHPLNTRDLQKQFDSLWRLRRLACRALAMGISRPTIANVGVRAARAFPPLTDRVVRLIKGQPVSSVAAAAPRAAPAHTQP